MVAARISHVVAELVEPFEGGLRRDIVGAGNELVVAGHDADVLQAWYDHGLRLSRRSQHAVFEIGRGEPEAVGQFRRERGIKPRYELMCGVGVDVPTRR